MDLQILATQQWLNRTYGTQPGWIKLEEDGRTGWGTIYGLRRGLQVELGVSPLSSGFGPATTASFTSKVGRISASTTSLNILRILNGSLWCKGYSGTYEGGPASQTANGIFQAIAPSISRVRSDVGLDPKDLTVDVKLLSSLLSMDAYVVPAFSRGSEYIREVQRWLNSTYLTRKDFALCPCDGIYSRQIQTALLFAIQYEIGMQDGVANGNFGPGTKSGIQAQGLVSRGSIDKSKNFVRLFQAALRLNGYQQVSFSGNFDADTESATREFQEFMELSTSGSADFSTWCSTLVSCGDNTISTRGFDSRTPLAFGQAVAARNNGYTHIGRYLVGSEKYITAWELDGLRAAGLKLVPIHQRFNNSVEVMTFSNGKMHGREAAARCRLLGLPSGSTVYFTVDFDPVGESISGSVVDYFRGVNEAIKEVINGGISVGVYGTRNVCEVILGEGLAESAFVAGMSTGYSGNMGFRMPQSWSYNQIAETKESFAGAMISIDRDVVSAKAEAIDLSGVVSPPIERDGSATSTGFDAFFEWVINAEIACEAAISNASSWYNPLMPYLIPKSIVDWLRKEEYWEGKGGMWMLYTPDPEIRFDASQNDKLAYSCCVLELSKMNPLRPVYARDVSHFAATMLGYLTWGIPGGMDNYEYGDLGGWALDLLQAWGVYDKLENKPDLSSWMSENIGKNSSSGFGYADIVADADAYLVAKNLTGDRLSDAMRGVFSSSSNERLGRFYRERFGGREENVIKSFVSLSKGIRVGPIPSFPLTDGILVKAAEATRMPSVEEAEICGRAYAEALSRLGGEALGH